MSNEHSQPASSTAAQSNTENGEATSLSIDEALTSQMTSQTTVSWSIDQNVIITTEDKLWRRIAEHLSAVEARKAWVAPASILATLIAALCTTTFKNALWLDASTWKAIFVLAAIVAAIWSVIAVWRAFKSKEKEDLVEAIKSSGRTQAAKLSIDGNIVQGKKSE